MPTFGGARLSYIRQVHLIFNMFENAVRFKAREQYPEYFAL